MLEIETQWTARELMDAHEALNERDEKTQEAYKDAERRAKGEK